jgi:hypothetical protein
LDWFRSRVDIQHKPAGKASFSFDPPHEPQQLFRSGGVVEALPLEGSRAFGSLRRGRSLPDVDATRRASNAGHGFGYPSVPSVR